MLATNILDSLAEGGSRLDVPMRRRPFARYNDSQRRHLFLRGIAMSQAVLEILDRIQNLPEEDRIILDEQLTQLAECQWTQNGKEQPRYPLRGSVVRFDEPTEPVADNDWEATR